MKHAGLAVVAACALLAPPAFSAAPWEGRWRLVTQTYGAGESNIAPEDVPVRLELVDAAGVPEGRVWAGDDERGAVAWPAFAKGAASAVAEVRFRRAAPGGTLETAYSVRPVAADDLVLVVRETYALAADGAHLEGTVEVRFEGGAMNRGGYTLHRRYERER